MNKTFLAPLILALTMIVTGCSKESKKTEQTSVDSPQIQSLTDRLANEKDPLEQARLLNKLIEKRTQKSLFKVNEKLIKSLSGHTALYEFSGPYKILVIPVQFSDVKFTDTELFSSTDGTKKAQEYLFGDNANSMSTYYSHISMGKFQLSGEVTNVITVDKKLVDYGEAISGQSDKDARGLVVDAIEKLKGSKNDADWWSEYDRWEVNDYDNDENFHEPDGFIDAVVLIYAGKDQASCQRSFDPNGEKIPSQDVPAGPRHDASVECFNRIWPHRWSIALQNTDPRYSKDGPIVEGKQRSSLNGYKINDELFALDYNMQSEFSDISTFSHEFGHSLTLPDVYSSGSDNSSGSWELMSQNAELYGQEMSSYSRLSLGWLSPKVIEQGQKSSAYLGAYSFVPTLQREQGTLYAGPVSDENGVSILSKVPEFEENVYRSIAVVTKPSAENREIVKTIPATGKMTAYSGKFDGSTRALKLKFKVPDVDGAAITYTTIHKVETETNFDSKDESVKIVTEYDSGEVLINGVVVKHLATVSGDQNGDTLVELNPLCEAPKVLDLRIKKNKGEITVGEEQEFLAALEICQKPIWVNESFDLKNFRGQEITFEVNYTTDAGFTEFGIVVDNVKVGDQLIDFENSPKIADGFKILENGSETINFNQFYLMEYRNPGENYVLGKEELSRNMDNNIETGTQSYFLDESKGSVADRFRLVKFNYRPGVLVWYFNSKYDDHANDAVAQKGEGYLLVINSKVGELNLPGPFADDKIKDENGHYNEKAENFVQLKDAQRNLFTCFAFTSYSTYIEGKAPECDLVGEFKDYAQKLTMDGKLLRYRRELGNDFLPRIQANYALMDRAYRNDAGTRTGLSTFSPKDSGDFSPFTVYKEVEGKMVLDSEETAKTTKVAANDSFNDKENEWSKFDRFKGDSAVVNKVGLSFKITSPSKTVLSKYSKTAAAHEDANYFRRPRVKIYFDWE
jgi:M6 family metalloprotease-like protein